MEQISHEMGIAPKSLTADAIEVLKHHDWPGNVRELKNVMQRAIVLSDGPEIDPTHLSIFDRHQPQDRAEHPSELVIHIPMAGMTLAEIEAEAMRITLEITGGNRSAAARILGVSRPTVHRKIHEYDLETDA
jgi:DNA-binding NtrC family response regulator